LLQPIGIATRAEPGGLLPRLGQPPSGVWRSVAQELSELALTHFGDNLISVALRGSTARNAAIEGGSDIDIVAIVRDPPVETPDDDIPLKSKLLPDVKIEASMYQLNELLASERLRWMRFALAYSGWTVWGEDVIAKLPDPILGTDCWGHLPGYATWLENYRDKFETAESDDERREICRWLMKSIIRSLFESIMFDEWAYSRDIYPCAEAAVKHYPGSTDAIWAAAELAVCPVSDIEIIDKLVNSLRTSLEKAYEHYRASV
jgi:predicted nucleotidyltransferase